MTKIFIVFLLLLSTNTFAKLPYFPIQFPRDDAAHYENVPYSVNTLSEWWYYNGTVTSNNGRRFGYYINYGFLQPQHKTALRYLGIQITDIDQQKVYGIRKFFSEKNSLYSTRHLEIQLGKNIFLTKIGNTYFLQGSLLAKKDLLRFSLQLTPAQNRPAPLLIHGNGLVDMWEDKNSYYYSYTRMTTKGFVAINQNKFDLDPQKSLSWMDHQWGDFMVKPGINQWFWTSVQLDNGLEINLAKILDKKTQQQIGGWANVVLPNDERIYLHGKTDFEYLPEPTTGKFPQVYQLTIPSLKLVLTLRSLVPEQSVNGIWEGVSEMTGTYAGITVHGQGYTESTVFQ